MAPMTWSESQTSLPTFGVKKTSISYEDPTGKGCGHFIIPRVDYPDPFQAAGSRDLRASVAQNGLAMCGAYGPHVNHAVTAGHLMVPSMLQSNAFQASGSNSFKGSEVQTSLAMPGVHRSYISCGVPTGTGSTNFMVPPTDLSDTPSSALCSNNLRASAAQTGLAMVGANRSYVDFGSARDDGSNYLEGRSMVHSNLSQLSGSNSLRESDSLISPAGSGTLKPYNKFQVPSAQKRSAQVIVPSKARSRPVCTSEPKCVTKSPFFEPVKLLLNEICSVDSNKVEIHPQPGNNDPRSAGKHAPGPTFRGASSLKSASREELEDVKATLEDYLDQTDRGYRKFKSESMNFVEQTRPASVSNQYAKKVRETVSRRYRAHRDTLCSEYKAVRKLLGEEETAPRFSQREPSFLRTNSQAREQGIQKQQMGMTREQDPWRTNRGLPEKAVSVLRKWMFEHFLHPYPQDKDKNQLAVESGLTREQVSNWFINARVRLWKPIVEQLYRDEIKVDQQAEIAKSASEEEYEQVDPVQNDDLELSLPHLDGRVRGIEAASNASQNVFAIGGSTEDDGRYHAFGLKKALFRGLGASQNQIELPKGYLDSSTLLPCDTSRFAREETFNCNPWQAPSAPMLDINLERSLQEQLQNPGRTVSGYMGLDDPNSGPDLGAYNRAYNTSSTGVFDVNVAPSTTVSRPEFATTGEVSLTLGLRYPDVATFSDSVITPQQSQNNPNREGCSSSRSQTDEDLSSFMENTASDLTFLHLHPGPEDLQRRSAIASTSQLSQQLSTEGNPSKRPRRSLDLF